MSVFLPPGVKGKTGTLFYSLDRGQTEIKISDEFAVVAPTSRSMASPGGSGTRVTFSISADKLPEGTTLDYAFKVDLVSLAGPCLGETVGVSPHAGGFHSVATAITDPLASPFAEALTVAAGAMGAQPDIPGMSPTEICLEYFAFPTPCDLYGYEEAPTVPAADVFPIPAITYTLDAESGGSGSSDHVCTFSARDLAGTGSKIHKTILHEPTTTRTGGRASAIEWRAPYVDPVGAIGLEGLAATTWLSGARGAWDVSQGFQWTFSAVGGAPSEFDATVILRSHARGDRIGYAAGSPSDHLADGVAYAESTLTGDVYTGVYVGDGTWSNGAERRLHQHNDPSRLEHRNTFGGYEGLFDATKHTSDDKSQRWESVRFQSGVGRHFMVDFSARIDTGAQLGGATAGVDFRDPDGVLPLNWRLYVYEIEIWAHDEAVSFTEC